MKSLEKRFEDLASDFAEHIKESGEIRSDLKWLKTAFWTLAGAGITFNITLVGALLIQRWK